jgi:diguanylate cyclase (GGDEF)-like protein
VVRLDVVGQHLERLDVVRLDVVGQHLERLDVEREHVVRLDVVRQHLERRQLAHRHVGLSARTTVAAGSSASTPARRRLHRPSPLWLLTALIGTAAALLITGPLDQLGPAHGALTLQWWSLGPLFLVAEVCVLHLYFGRDAHSVSLSEIPLVLGLLFARPTDLVVAQLVGAAIALSVHRRQPLRKLLFNLSNLALSNCIAVWVFRVALAHHNASTPQGWGAVLLGATAGCVAGALLIVWALALTRSVSSPAVAWRVVRDAVIGSVAVTSFGLIAATVLWFQPLALVLLVVPLVVVFTAYRGYSAQNERTSHLEFLYEASRMLQSSNDVESAMRSLLSRACAMFHAELGELTLFPSTGDELAYRTRVGRGHDAEVMVPVDLEPLDEGMMELLAGAGALLIRSGPRDPVADAYLRSRGLRDAMVVSLHGEVRVMGTMLLGNRNGDVKSFDDEDIKLLATLASHASTALENGRLEKSVSRLVEVEQQLRQQASHDPTTGLPNRVLFSERLAAALRRADAARGLPAVLFLDVDNFKQVNERVGRAAGDALLAAVGSRLRGVVRAPDTVARVGGEEFAVLLERTHVADQAHVVAERIVAALKHPFGVGDVDEVQLTASIGVVSQIEAGSTVLEVIDRADTALFRAKQAGRGRHRSLGDGDGSADIPVSAA